MNPSPLASSQPAPSLPVATASETARQTEAARVRQGLWLAALGVLLFALTLPMTRLANGTAAAPQLPPDFVAYGRAVVAALLSLGWLALRRTAWPTPAQWPVLL